MTNLSVPSVLLADANWYGSLRGGVEVGGGNDASFKDGGSRWGIKGSSEISEGLSAIYRFEHKISTENASQPGGRLAYAGLSGSFGTVSLGQVWSASFNHVGGITDGSWFYGNSETSYRVGNALSYAMSAGAISMQLDAIMDGGKDTGDSVDQLEFGMTVDLGDVGKLGLAYVDTKDHMVTNSVFMEGTPTMVSVTPGEGSTPTMVSVTPGEGSTPTMVSVTPGEGSTPTMVSVTPGEENTPTMVSVTPGEENTPSSVRTVDNVVPTNVYFSIGAGGQLEVSHYTDSKGMRQEYDSDDMGQKDALKLVYDTDTAKYMAYLHTPTDADSTSDGTLQANKPGSTDTTNLHTTSVTPELVTVVGFNGADQVKQAMGTNFRKIGSRYVLNLCIDTEGSGEDAVHSLDRTNNAVCAASEDEQAFKVDYLDLENAVTITHPQTGNPTTTVDTLSSFYVYDSDAPVSISAEATRVEGTKVEPVDGEANTPTMVNVTPGEENTPTMVSVTPGEEGTPTEVAVTPGEEGTPTEVAVTPGEEGTPTEVAVTPGMPSHYENVTETIAGSRATHVAAQFSLGAITAYLGYSQNEENGSGMKDKTTHYGISGGLGDTGISFHAMARSKDNASGMDSNPWLVGLTKGLGGGATVMVEHGNADDGASGKTRFGLKVDF